MSTFNEEFLKSKVSKEQVESKKRLNEGAGGTCTLEDKPDKWILITKFPQKSK